MMSKAVLAGQRQAWLGRPEAPTPTPAAPRLAWGIQPARPARNASARLPPLGASTPLQQSIAGRSRVAGHQEKFYVLSLLAESVELNALVQRFETLAGRSAMIGFIVATVAELAVPREGLFGAWAHFDAFAVCAALLVATSAVLAIMSKRRLGTQLQGAVLDSLTAKLGSVAEGFDAKLSSSLDYIFDNSLTGLVNLDIDEFL